MVNQVLNPLFYHLFALIGSCKLVGNEHIGVNTHVHNCLCLGNLILNRFSYMTGSDNAHTFFMAMVNNILRQLQPLFFCKEEHLAGLTHCKNTGDLMVGIPVDNSLDSFIVNFVVRCKWGDHYRPYAVGNFFHRNSFYVEFFHFSVRDASSASSFPSIWFISIYQSCFF